MWKDSIEEIDLSYIHIQWQLQFSLRNCLLNSLRIACVSSRSFTTFAVFYKAANLPNSRTLLLLFAAISVHYVHTRSPPILKIAPFLFVVHMCVTSSHVVEQLGQKNVRQRALNSSRNIRTTRNSCQNPKVLSCFIIIKTKKLKHKNTFFSQWHWYIRVPSITFRRYYMKNLAQEISSFVVHTHFDHSHADEMFRFPLPSPLWKQGCWSV